MTGSLVGDREVLTIRSASALRFSKGCSSLNLDRMMNEVVGRWVLVCVFLVVPKVLELARWMFLCNGLRCVDLEECLKARGAEMALKSSGVNQSRHV
jgi:hypothetical protein